MSFVIKQLGFNDLPLLLPLREETDVLASPVRDISADDVKKFILSSYRNIFTNEELKKKNEESMRLIVVEMENQIVGYIVLLTDGFEGITQEKQVEICDLVIKKGVAKEEVLCLLLEEAKKVCQEKSIKYLVYTIQSAEKEILELLKKYGFVIQTNYIVKNVKRIKKWRTLKQNLRIRWAKISDLVFLLWLNNVSSVNYVLPNHDVPTADVQNCFFRAYADNLPKWLINDPNFVVLIADDVEKKESLGYIMLWLGTIDTFTGEKFTYIYDIAVRQEYWGKYITHYLMEAAEKLVVKKGFNYLIGEISDSNQRALRTSVVSLKFYLERYRLVKNFEKKI